MKQKNYATASIPMLAAWSKEGDKMARQLLIRLCSIKK